MTGPEKKREEDIPPFYKYEYREFYTACLAILLSAALVIWLLYRLASFLYRLTQ
jgi:hypothetical protein